MRSLKRFLPLIVSIIILLSFCAIFVFWQAWQVFSGGQKVLRDLRAYIPATLQMSPSSENLAQQTKTDLQNFNQRIQTLSQQIYSITPLKNFLSKTQLPNLITKLDDLNTLTQALLTNTHRYIILFQNSEELRATGGFMGSYALVELQNGRLTQLDIQDIYQPDGQFHGFVEAPPGIKEYLSGGKGMRLPDANWSPDLPTSAATILNFFSLANEKNIDGLVIVNLSVAQDLLKLTGDIPLPDYQITVTPDNLPEVARADRSQFFPGSYQKRNFLAALFTQLKIKLNSLDKTQQHKLAKLLIDELTEKNIQLYSSDEVTQQIFTKNNIAGQVQTPTPPPDFYLMLVESNVGINKANRGIIREVHLHSQNTTGQLQIIFHNTNPPTPIADATTNATSPAKPLDYINYQRLFILPTTQILGMQIGSTPINHWDENMITTSTNQQLKQIGFLVPVPVQTQQTVTIHFQTPQPISTLFIQKQSGLPVTSYSVQADGKEKNFSLEKDEVIRF